MNLSLSKLTKAMGYSLLASTLFTVQLANANAEEETQEQKIERQLAQQKPANEIEQVEEDEEIEVFRVTGSRINQTSFEGPMPVEVITAEDMAKGGHLTVFDALQNLSQNSGSVTGAENSSGFTPNAKVLNLRGFGPQYTLVLVNGRRIANYPAAYGSSATVVNINSIPMAAVKQIEIVSSGASAIYGSDAAAGVVNIILKDDFEGTSIGGRFGTAVEGNGNTYNIQLAKGIDFNAGNITAVLEYSRTEAVYGADRPDFDSDLDFPYDIGGDYEGGLMNRGAVKAYSLAAIGYDAIYNGLPSNHQYDTYIDPGKDACNAIPGMEYSSRDRIYDEDNPSAAPGAFGSYCGFDMAKRRTLRNPSEKISAMLSTSYNINDDVKFFADVLFSDIKASNDKGFLSFYGVVEEANSSAPIFELGAGKDKNGNPQTIKLPGENFGFSHNIHTLSRLLPSEEIGDTAYHFDEQAVSISAGFKGELDDYTWELSFTNSQYQMQTTQAALYHEQVESMFLGEKVLSAQGDELSLFGTTIYDNSGTNDIYNTLSAADIEQLVGQTTQDNETYSRMLTAVISGPVLELPAGEMQFAAVVEWMNEGFDFKTDDLALASEGKGWYGLAGFGGVGERDRVSFGGEFLIPVIQGLDITAAIRYDEYIVEGKTNDSWTPAISFQYRPMDTLLIRGSYSGIFRAPDLQQLFTNSSAFGSGTDYLSCYQQIWEGEGVTAEQFSNGADAGAFQSFCLSGAYTQQFKAETLPGKDQGLKNESGESIGVGFVYAPLDNLTITFDYYELEINDQIRKAQLSNLLWDEFVCAYKDQVSDPVIYGCDKVAALINRSGEVDPLLGQSNLTSVNTTPFNLAMYRQTGADVKLDYRHETNDFGLFNAGLAYTGIISTKYDALEDDSYDAVDIHDSLNTLEPIDSLVGTLTWNYEQLTVSMSARYRSGLGPRRPELIKNSDGNDALFDNFGNEIDYIIDEDGNNVDEDGDELIGNISTKVSQKRLSAWITANLVMSYRFNDDDSRIGLTVTNVFDNKAPKDKSMPYNAWPWYNIGAYGGSAIGREVYLNFEHIF